MSEGKMREEFEAWARDNAMLLFVKVATGRYSSWKTELAWQAWQESRAALWVELPIRPAASMFASIGEARCAQEAHDRVVEAIEAAGVGVKE